VAEGVEVLAGPAIGGQALCQGRGRLETHGRVDAKVTYGLDWSVVRKERMAEEIGVTNY
jgi:hypothetical protein